MIALFTVVCILGLGAVLAWNFYPPLREKLRGWTTVLDGLLTGAIWVFGQVSDALQEAQKAGYIPSQIVSYVPIVILLWFVLKRVTTKTPVGKK